MFVIPLVHQGDGLLGLQRHPDDQTDPDHCSRHAHRFAAPVKLEVYQILIKDGQ